jgi:hypothetical protein
MDNPTRKFLTNQIAAFFKFGLGMGHRTQTSMFNIGVDIGSDH